MARTYTNKFNGALTTNNYVAVPYLDPTYMSLKGSSVAPDQQSAAADFTLALGTPGLVTTMHSRINHVKPKGSAPVSRHSIRLVVPVDFVETDSNDEVVNQKTIFTEVVLSFNIPTEHLDIGGSILSEQLGALYSVSSNLPKEDTKADAANLTHRFSSALLFGLPAKFSSTPV